MPMDWRHDAVCRDEDPELFFPVGKSGPAEVQIAEAKAVCRRCPVASSCLAWALESGQDAGVWGGLDEDERRALQRTESSEPRGFMADQVEADVLFWLHDGLTVIQCATKLKHPKETVREVWERHHPGVRTPAEQRQYMPLSEPRRTPRKRNRKQKQEVMA